MCKCNWHNKWEDCPEHPLRRNNNNDIDSSNNNNDQNEVWKPVAPTSIDQLLCSCMFMALTMGGIKIEKYGDQLEFVSYHILDNHTDKPLALKDKEGTIIVSGKEIKPMLHKFCFMCGKDLRNCIVRKR